MELKLNKRERTVLSLIAIHKIITVSQLAAITQRSRQVIRKNLRSFKNGNLVETSVRGYGRGAGRPEEIIFLTEKAAKILKNEGLFLENVSLITRENIDSLFVDHDLLVNWFYIHLIQMEKSVPGLTINPHAPGFILKHQKKTYGFFDARIRIKTSDDLIEFIPDGIFSAYHKGTGKSLLFFLEVDMDTESIASLDRNLKDVRQKILNYQALFRNGYYKRYGEIFNSKFNGFRLLFLVNSPARLASLSRLVQEMPPADFIWFTDQKKMFSDGLSAEIWVRGGKTDRPSQSIIGPDLAVQTPVIDGIK
jgi:DNA-binding MarR family transcriptional regulator